MSDVDLNLAHPPIVEAVVDVDCDMPPGQEFSALGKPARDVFQGAYPKFRTAFVQTHHIEKKGDQAPHLSVQHSIQAFQFLQSDERQLTQVRSHGFSFNRLAPYTSLDDYLPHIEKAWNWFVSIASPVEIRSVRLRYINRILLPLKSQGGVELSDYLTIGPRLPDESRFALKGFLTQQSAVESVTGNRINIILTGQPMENDKAPVILDITAESEVKGDPQNWPWLSAKIQSLRVLKNDVFKNTITERCRNLFQQH